MSEQAPARQSKKLATQARILDAARIHFERDGFHETNLRGIAADAGVATGTVLLHFTDKLGLLHAALHDDLEEAIRRSLASSSRRNRDRLLVRLTAVVRPFYAYYAARPSLSRVLLRESLLAESPWRERFAAQLTRVNVHVVALVEAAKAEGEVASTVHPGLFAAAFSSFYYFALIGWVQGALEDPMPLFKKLMAQHIAATSSISRQDDP